MKKILLAVLLFPVISYSQGLFVATSTSGDKIESNMGALATGVESVVVTSLTLDTNNLGIINKDVAQLIRVYPNPTNGVITINTDFDKIEIFDATGKHIETQSFVETETIDLNHLENGIYFLSIFKNTTYLKTTKIQKQ